MITLGVDVWRLGKNQSEHRIVKPEISTLRPPKQGSKPKRRGKMLHFPIARRRYYRYTCLPSDSFSLTLLSPTICSMLAQLFPQSPAALLVSVCTGIRDAQKPVAPPKLQRNVVVSFALMLSRYKCVSRSAESAAKAISLALHGVLHRLKSNRFFVSIRIISMRKYVI